MVICSILLNLYFRYMLLSYCMAMRTVSFRVKKRFPDLQHLVDAGLMRDDELKVSSFYLSICLSFYLASYLSKNNKISQILSIKFMVIYLSIYLIINLYIYLAIFLTIYLYVCLSIYLFFCLLFYLCLGYSWTIHLKCKKMKCNGNKWFLPLTWATYLSFPTCLYVYLSIYLSWTGSEM